MLIGGSSLAAKIGLVGLILAEKVDWETSLASFSAKISPAVLILWGLILVTDLELKVFVYKLRYNHQ